MTNRSRSQKKPARLSGTRQLAREERKRAQGAGRAAGGSVRAGKHGSRLRLGGLGLGRDTAVQRPQPVTNREPGISDPTVRDVADRRLCGVDTLADFGLCEPVRLQVRDEFFPVHDQHYRCADIVGQSA